MMTQVVSVADLLTDKQFKKAILEDNKKELASLLWQIGVDTKQPYEFVNKLHRPKSFLPSQEPMYGPMIEYYGRTDTQWLNSEWATADEIIDACEDAGMRTDMILMSKHVDSTASILEHIRNNKD